MASQGWPKTNTVKDLENYVTNMTHVFNTRGHLHIAQERMEAGEVGDAIARYNHANQQIVRAGKFTNSNMNVWLQSIKNTVTDLHQKAVNANETVYFLRIPKELPPLEGLGKGLGRPTSVAGLTKVISNRDADPFFGIVPQHVAEIASKHFHSMQELVGSASKSVTSYRGRTHTALNALGVSGVIESLSSESKDQGRIPEHLRAKILAMRSNGKSDLAEKLVSRTTQADEILEACGRRVEEVQAIMVKESQVDEAYANQYGATLWRGYRPQSMLAPHAQEIHKLLHQQEEQIAKAVRQPIDHTKVTLSSSLKDLSRLDWPLDDLDALMPYTKTKAVKEQTMAVMENVEKLKKFIARFDQVDEQNSTKLKELNALMQNDSVVHTLSAVDVDQHEAILDAASNDIKDIVSCIQANISSGDALLEGVEDIMNTLAVTRSEDPTTVEIQQVCTMIETAIDLHHRLEQDLSEIDASATQVLENLDGLVSSAQSFALSRQLEADDIKANIEYQIAAKLKEMDAKKSSETAVLESKKRQDELRAQLDALENQRNSSQQERMTRQYETGVVQQTLATATAEVDHRNDRMQQLLNQQRMAGQQAQSNVPAYAPPSTYYAPPPQQQHQQYAPQASYQPPQNQQQFTGYQSYQQPPPQQFQQGPPPPQQYQQAPQYATAPPSEQYYAPPPASPGMMRRVGYVGTPQFGGGGPPPPAPPQGPPPPFYAQLPHPSNYHYEAPPHQ
ncbi:Hypothetical protein, putative [Bodo saltans]|uniref:BRO1 domain-containing protein n=1 Tax=Bodo saltans TaxID=75058 RepID=A0A0S4JNC4_BODSA|nr:Hypothetical protein, putative [Bodo saltans]|eukprot:CUG91929.1 Hypothetical protein, putative [Bodo saltans]